MQAQLEHEERSNEVLRVENDGLRRDLETMRQTQDLHQQMQVQYENERAMRINSEGDISRLREQLADQMAQSKKEIDTLRRAIDDMKYTNEEQLRQINVKNEEIESMMDQMDNLSKIIGQKEDNGVDLKA